MKLGIIGAGQLARMMALAAHPLGIECHCTAQDNDDSAAGVSKLYPINIEEPSTLQDFIAEMDVISFENENIDSNVLNVLEQCGKIFPGKQAITIAQDRLLEKTEMTKLAIAVTPFQAIDSNIDMQRAVEALSLPYLIKTRRLGYDGKGQYLIKQQQDIELAWQQLSGQALIAEQFMPFDFEVSLIAVRSSTGETAFYPLTHNIHRHGILRQSIAPYQDSNLQQQAELIANKLLSHFNYVGVLAIEFFVKDQQLYVNELAPRVHNSGHWTIEGAVTSQFENHVRAVCGLPLGNTETTGQASMINCIGQMPSLTHILSFAQTHYHSYNKSPRPGRKVGHITTVNATTDVIDQLKNIANLNVDN